MRNVAGKSGKEFFAAFKALYEHLKKELKIQKASDIDGFVPSADDIRNYIQQGNEAADLEELAQLFAVFQKSLTDHFKDDEQKSIITAALNDFHLEFLTNPSQSDYLSVPPSDPALLLASAQVSPLQSEEKVGEQVLEPPKIADQGTNESYYSDSDDEYEEVEIPPQDTAAPQAEQVQEQQPQPPVQEQQPPVQEQSQAMEKVREVAQVNTETLFRHLINEYVNDLLGKLNAVHATGNEADQVSAIKERMLYLVSLNKVDGPGELENRGIVYAAEQYPTNICGDEEFLRRVEKEVSNFKERATPLDKAKKEVSNALDLFCVRVRAVKALIEKPLFDSFDCCGIDHAYDGKDPIQRCVRVFIRFLETRETYSARHKNDQGSDAGYDQVLAGIKGNLVAKRAGQIQLISRLTSVGEVFQQDCKSANDASNQWLHAESFNGYRLYTSKDVSSEVKPTDELLAAWFDNLQAVAPAKERLLTRIGVTTLFKAKTTTALQDHLQFLESIVSNKEAVSSLNYFSSSDDSQWSYVGLQVYQLILRQCKSVINSNSEIMAGIKAIILAEKNYDGPEGQRWSKLNAEVDRLQGKDIESAQIKNAFAAIKVKLGHYITLCERFKLCGVSLEQAQQSKLIRVVATLVEYMREVSNDCSSVPTGNDVPAQKYYFAQDALGLLLNVAQCFPQQDESRVLDNVQLNRVKLSWVSLIIDALVNDEYKSKMDATRGYTGALKAVTGVDFGKFQAMIPELQHEMRRLADDSGNHHARFAFSA